MTRRDLLKSSGLLSAGLISSGLAHAGFAIFHKNKPWAKKFSGVFVIKDGTFRTADLDKPGLGVTE